MIYLQTCVGLLDLMSLVTWFKDRDGFWGWISLANLSAVLMDCLAGGWAVAPFDRREIACSEG